MSLTPNVSFPLFSLCAIFIKLFSTLELADHKPSLLGCSLGIQMWDSIYLLWFKE